MAQPGTFVTSTRSEFDDVVRVESRRLYAVAISIMRDSGEAEDAVQETMVKAWRSWGMLRNSERRTAWLTRICVNHCISRRRHGLRRFFTSLDDSPRETEDPRALAAFDPADPDLDRAMRLLTVHQSAVVTLHYHHGYTLDECAELMGCRPGTVRSHLNRALTTLRGELVHA